MKLIAPSLNFNDIKDIASSFLDFYLPDESIPVPVEEIIELKMKAHIVAMAGMKHQFDIDAFVNSSFDTITIDDFVFTNYEERARFTLAHEIGHIVLHKDLYGSKEIQTIENYVLFQESISDDEYSILERQADAFAGCLLMPSKSLKEKINDCQSAESVRWAFALLPEVFKVSQEAFMIQLKKENITLPKNLIN